MSKSTHDTGRGSFAAGRWLGYIFPERKILSALVAMLNSPVFRIWLIPMVVIMAGLAIACNNGAIATAPAAPASSTTAALAPATAYPTYTPYPTYTLIRHLHP